MERTGRSRFRRAYRTRHVREGGGATWEIGAVPSDGRKRFYSVLVGRGDRIVDQRCVY